MSVHTQFQIRENAAEAQEFVKDLYEWEVEVRKTEKGRKTRGQGESEDENRPPVRARTELRAQEAPEELTTPSSRLMRGQDKIRPVSMEGRKIGVHPYHCKLFAGLSGLYMWSGTVEYGGEV